MEKIGASPLNLQHITQNAASAPSLGVWTTGLLGCFEDLGPCFMAFLLPCIPVGQIAHIVDGGESSCWLAGCLLCVLSFTGFPCVYTSIFRSLLRQKYSLPEEPCNDCCVDWLCPPCSIAQQYRELQNRGIQPSLGFEAVKHIYDQPPPVQKMHP